MKKIMAFFLLCFSLNTLSGELEKYCNEFEGDVFKSYRCPKSGITLSFGFCVFKNHEGITQFFDGCTGPKSEFHSLFYPHCIQHDLCYHHEPITNGLSQKDCDLKFKEDLLNSCQAISKKKKCESLAKTMYTAVRAFGKLAFNCAEYKAHY